MIKKILIGCGGLLALVVVAFVALLVWAAMKTARADDHGRAFCATVKPGTPIGSVQAAAERHPDKPHFGTFGDDREVSFHGAFLHSATCRMTIVDGKVATTQFIILDD